MAERDAQLGSTQRHAVAFADREEPHCPAEDRLRSGCVVVRGAGPGVVSSPELNTCSDLRAAAALLAGRPCASPAPGGVVLAQQFASPAVAIGIAGEGEYSGVVDQTIIAAATTSSSEKISPRRPKGTDAAAPHGLPWGRCPYSVPARPRPRASVTWALAARLCPTDAHSGKGHGPFGGDGRACIVKGHLAVADRGLRFVLDGVLVPLFSCSTVFLFPAVLTPLL